MKKFYSVFKHNCLIVLLVILAGVIDGGSIFAQVRATKEGSIRVMVSEELAANLERSAMGRTANNKLVTGIAKLDAINAKHSVSNMKRVFPPAGKFEAKHRKYGLHLWYEVVMDKGISVTDAVIRYKNLEDIKKAEPIYEKVLIGADQKNFGPKVIPINTVKTLTESPDDPEFPKQWHYNNTGQMGGTQHADINLLKAWGIESGNRKVIVALTDGGIDITHEDLADNIWTNKNEIPDNDIDDDNNGYVDDIHGYNFYKGTGKIVATSHGTHVAGTIAASTNNGIGVAGVAGGSGIGDGVQLMSCQVFETASNGDGFAMTYVYAADNGAVISQNSWGYGTYGVYEDAVIQAIDYFIAEAGTDANGNQVGPMRGGIVIFAAGNSASSEHYYPGFYEPVLSVSSTNHHDQKAFYSNYGDWVDVSAPGGETDDLEEAGILSTLPGNKYGYYQGTSMACPHVSGVAALVVSKFGMQGFTPEMLRDRLQYTADNINNKNANYIGMLGTGRINAFAALQEDDHVAPEAITDLFALEVKAKSIEIAFTAPTDAGNEKASRYEVYYSTSPITSENFTSATFLQGTYRALEAGNTEFITIGNLYSDKTYYIVVRSTDFFGNYSAISNILQQATGLLPSIEVTPSSLSAGLLTAEVAVQNITISNNGAGPLEFSLAKDSNMPDIVRFSPETGNLLTGESMDVEVTFDAHKLYGGDYSQVLTITSNDSVNATVSVPIQINVTSNGAPIATLDPSSYNFEAVYAGSQKTKTIHLYNEGTEPLEITNVVSDDSHFTSDFTNTISIPPFKEGRLAISFTASAVTGYSATATISTNDAAHAELQIALSGYGTMPPDMTVTPEFLGAELPTGQTTTQSFSISNTGLNPLKYSAHVIPGKSESILEKEITISTKSAPASQSGVKQRQASTGSTQPQTITIRSSRESSKPVRVLIISPDSYVSDFTRIMAGFKDLYVRELTPNYFAGMEAKNLVNYKVIIVTNNEGWASFALAEHIGNVLADFVDAGGKVIIGNNAYADDDYYKLRGRFINEHYGPFEPAFSSTWNSVSIGDRLLTDHPLLEAVDALTYDGRIDAVGLADDATAIAKWSTGELMLATNSNVVAVNALASISYGSFPWSGDLPTLYHNAVNWLAGSTIVRVDKPSGQINPFAEELLQATFDAADLQSGTYANAIFLMTDVPGKELYEIPATLEVRGPEFSVTEDSIWSIVEKGLKRTRTITLKNDGADAHAYTVKLKDNGLAPFKTSVSGTVNENEIEEVPVITRTTPYAGPAHDFTSPKISWAETNKTPATQVSGASVGAAYKTDFESYVRGDISLANDGWEGEFSNWTTSIANPANGFKHLRGISDGNGESLVITPGLYDHALPYSTTSMKVNFTGTGVTWQIVPYSAAVDTVVTRLQVNSDGTLMTLVKNGADFEFWGIDATLPEGYFDLTIEVNRSTAEFNIYFDNVKVFTGMGATRNIDHVAIVSPMEEAGPMIDIDDFTIIDGRKELLPKYIIVSPLSGTLGAGESKDITLDFDASEMKYGSYLSDVTIDIERVQQLTVPVTTDVVGDVAITVYEIEMTNIYYQSDTLTHFNIYNSGGGDLNYKMKLSGSDTTWLTLSTTKGIISAHDKVEVTVNFTSKNLTPGVYTAQIVIDNNSVTTPQLIADVSLTVLNPASIDVTPIDVTASVATGQTQHHQLTIRNTGESPLTFAFENQFSIESIKAAYVGTFPSREDVSVLYATGFEDFIGEDVNGQFGWVAENEEWTVEKPYNGGSSYLYVRATSQATSTAYSPLVSKGIQPFSSTIMSVRIEDEKSRHAMWQIIPRSVTMDQPVTKFKISTDRSVQVLFKNASGDEEFQTISYKFPERELVKLRIDVERATALFTVYLDGKVVFTGQGFAGDIEQVIFYASNERTDWLDIDDFMILDGVLPWFNVSLEKGTVLAGQELLVDLMLDAQNLPEGDYTEVLTVSSNDPQKLTQQIPVHLTVTGPPVVELDKHEFAVTIYQGAKIDETLTITNTGEGTLNYTFPGYDIPSNNGRMSGPDGYSYYWIDSDDDKGPVFDWIDISTTGNPIYLDDNGFLYVDLPFSFPFYGITYDRISIISDGVLGLGSGQLDLENDPNFDIPNPQQNPNNFIAPFWDDLDPGSGGVIYYQQDADKFIVQFMDVPIFNKELGNTFQAILYPDGRIKYQYLSIDESATVTIGIENKSGTDGLEIIYNKPYVKNNLAIMIASAPLWARPSVGYGAVDAGSNEEVTIAFDASGLAAGVYNGILFFENDDSKNPVIPINLSLTVLPAYTISGTVTDHEGKPLEGITFEGFLTEIISDATGHYEATVEAGWSGTYKPISTEYQFSPAEIQVTSIQQDMTDQNFTSDVVLGVDDERYNIAVYPNPSEGTFLVELPGTDDVKIEVYNTIGKLVMTGQPKKGEENYSLTLHQKGVFVLIIRIKSEQYVQRIIVR